MKRPTRATTGRGAKAKTIAAGTTPTSNKLEPVLAFHKTATQLVFRVFTGGCTEAEHFRLDVLRHGGTADVTLTRIVPDTCKGHFPEGTEIRFDCAETGLNRDDVVQLNNPIQQTGRS